MSENSTETTDPAEFNLDDWIEGAARPQRTVRVYGRADLISELDQIERDLALAENQADQERAVSETSGVADLQQRWDSVAEVFFASALDITVRALVDDEIGKLEDEVATAVALKKDDPKTPRQRALRDAGRSALSLAQLEAAIVTPEMSFEQVRKMHERIGEGQMRQLVNAFMAASYAEQKVKAPFSRAS